MKRNKYQRNHLPKSTFGFCFLEIESKEEFNDFQKIFTGVGKINAVYHLLKA